MKPLNISLYNVVLRGKTWDKSFSPCSKEAIRCCRLAESLQNNPEKTDDNLTTTTARYLENNESIVSWLCPRDSDKCSAHIPAIFYQNKYWSLSLRMSKCIYRHVRLRRGFANIQSIHGVQTLRIPQTLLQEKRRTQIRFEVSMPSRVCACLLYTSPSPRDRQKSRMPSSA